jgi:hypothetical protein
MGIGVEGEMDILKNLLGAIGLIQTGHMINELTCHSLGCSTGE